MRIGCDSGEIAGYTNRNVPYFAADCNIVLTESLSDLLPTEAAICMTKSNYMP
jgi:hypothetical protein